jgi:hypothetical protein
VRHVSVAQDDSERRDWDLPPMEAGGDAPPSPEQPPEPDTTAPLDRPHDDDVTDDTERRDWDLP